MVHFDSDAGLSVSLNEGVQMPSRAVKSWFPVLIALVAIAFLAFLVAWRSFELSPDTIFAELGAITGYLLYVSLLAAAALITWYSFDSPRRQFGNKFESTAVIFVLVIAFLHSAALYLAVAGSPPHLAQMVSRFMTDRLFAPVRATTVLLIVMGFFWVLGRGMGGKYLPPPLLTASVFVLIAVLSAMHIGTLPVRNSDYFLAAAVLLPLALTGLGLLQALAANETVVSYVWPTDMPPATDNLDKNNRIFLWLLGASTPFAASASSIMLASAGIWAAFYIVIRRLKPEIEMTNLPIVVSVFVFFVTMAVPTIAHSADTSDFITLLKLFPFLAVLFVVPRLYRSSRRVLVPCLANGAAVGVYVFAGFAVYEYFTTTLAGPFGFRISAFSGNPVPAAYAAVLFSLIAGLGLDRVSPHQLYFRIGAMLAGFTAATFTGTVSVLLIVPVILIALATRYRTELRKMYRPSLIPKRIFLGAGALVIIAGTVLVASSPLLLRIQNYSTAIVDHTDRGEGESLNLRITMWKAGIEAASNAPVTGYGIQNRFAAIVPYLPLARDGKEISFTHPHSGFLTMLISGGLPGLLATMALLVSPCLVAWRCETSPWRDDLVLLTFVTTLVYSIGGLIGIMFFHDANDAIFCWVLILTAAHMRPEHAAAA